MSTNVRIDAPPQATSSRAARELAAPPQSLEAEKGVLGSIVLDPLLCDDLALIVRPEDFYSDDNATIYRHMLAINGEGRRIDTTLLVERLKQSGDYDRVGGAAYLAEIYHDVPFASNGPHYAHLVREKAILRRLILAGGEIVELVQHRDLDPREVLDQAEAKIFAIRDERGSGQLATFEDVIHEVWERLDARMDKDQDLRACPTGFADFDNMTGGLHEGELIILAARPSMGKTAFATNIAEQVAMGAGLPVLFVSLEMSRLELGERMLASYSRVDSHKMRQGRLTPQDQAKLRDKGGELSNGPLFVDDSPSRNMTEIAATARRLKRKHGLGLIVIDYLQLIEPDNSRDPRQEQVARIARRLKGLARELSVPVLCLAQLNRQAEAGKGENIPRLSHLRESGAIEQDADVVMFVHRDEYYMTQEEREQNPEVVGQARIILAKQRNGPTGEVPLHWFAQFTRFESAAAPWQQDEGF